MIAAFATISAGCAVGEGTVIYPGVYVGPDCRIGRDCILYPNVTLYDGCILGDRVTIHAGASIGQDGFGYATHRAGTRRSRRPAGWSWATTWRSAPAARSTGRRWARRSSPTARSSPTWSPSGTGRRVGKACLMVAQSGIAGSTVVGNGCVFGGQSGAEGHIKIGDGVRVAAQTGVVGDVPAGMQIGGSPSMPLAEARRAWMALSRLPQLRTAVRRLAREVAALKRRLGVDEGPDAERPGVSLVPRQPVGVIAGAGRLPFLVAAGIRKADRPVVMVASGGPGLRPPGGPGRRVRLGRDHPAQRLDARSSPATACTRPS